MSTVCPLAANLQGAWIDRLQSHSVTPSHISGGERHSRHFTASAGIWSKAEKQYYRLLLDLSPADGSEVPIMTLAAADVGRSHTVDLLNDLSTRPVDSRPKGHTVDIRTLVVDDDQDSCNLIERILKNEGYRVGTLTDPRKVEDELRKKHVHLAIVDLKDARALRPWTSRRSSSATDSTAVTMTGYATLDSAVGALRYGVVYLSEEAGARGRAGRRGEPGAGGQGALAPSEAGSCTGTSARDPAICARSGR